MDAIFVFTRLECFFLGLMARWGNPQGFGQVTYVAAYTSFWLGLETMRAIRKAEICITIYRYIFIARKAETS